ncbi:hypothetical protein GCK72_009586 [Caenorhabditis remanei]|uniref:Uncharacterized protein n=1 Tax=Caenorhabditis remanei TaxID=31234 RepID=A0A6A5H0L4_CAERE|nr:hypothetical protein GCK72_009586 [Caenorhabditis remanei]KAF1761330.1 hypothetical protein GCK72_009586 [Caenorhabditis remanei]
MGQREEESLKIEETTEDSDYTHIRGLYVFQLYLDHPFLANCSKSRTRADNIKRRRIWNYITASVKEKFEGNVTVDKVKKLAEYWKNKYSDPLHISPRIALALSELTGRDTVFPSSPPPPPSELEKHEIDAILSQRVYWIVKAAKMYMKESGIDMDTLGRSTESNDRRTIMWSSIREEINRRYSGKVGVLGFFQTKKVFSNYKRRHPGEFKDTSDESIFGTEMKMDCDEVLEKDQVVEEKQIESIELEMKSEPIETEGFPWRKYSGESGNEAEKLVKSEDVERVSETFEVGTLDVLVKKEIA